MPQKNIRERYRKDIIEPAAISWEDKQRERILKQWELDFWTSVLWGDYKIDKSHAPKSGTNH